MPLRLCLIAPVPPPNGGVANWERILENRIKKDNNMSLYLVNIATNKRTTDGRTIFDRIIYSGYIMCRAYFKVRSLVNKNEIDVVHLATSGGLGFYRDLLLLKFLKKKKVKSIYHIHFGRSILYHRKNGREWRQLCKAIKLADQTISIDKKTYELLKTITQNITYINNPIDVESYNDYKIEETKSIVYIGWIIKSKGIEELLEAFNLFNKENKFIYKLKLIGPGNEKYIESLKIKYPFEYVELTGEIDHDEAMKMLAKAEIFVLPSYTEGFPNVVLEAMALRKPIIATEVGAIPEMLKNGAGIIVRPYNSEDIYNALIRLSINDVCRDEYGKNAYKKVRDEYDMEKTYMKYKFLWEE